MKSGITEEYIELQQAEPDMIKTIAYLLAQTVALHFYEMYAYHLLHLPLCLRLLSAVQSFELHIPALPEAMPLQAFTASLS